jgi:hypothetical protein
VTGVPAPFPSRRLCCQPQPQPATLLWTSTLLFSSLLFFRAVLCCAVLCRAVPLCQHFPTPTKQPWKFLGMTTLFALFPPGCCS